jgi:putative salt-induced outer membrane protein YdiY
MKHIALYCVAVCTISWASLCSAQLPAAGFADYERLPPINAAPPSNARVPLQLPLALTPNPHPNPAEIVEPEVLEVPVEEVIEEAPQSPWSGSFELGMNGSNGNSELFNFRFGVDLERKTDWTKFTLDLDYKNNSTDEVQTANRLFLDVRDEWSPSDGPWSLYVHGTTEYDEFKDFDSRIAADAGLTYNFIKNDITRLAGRFGLGTSHEIGGSNDEWVPEGSFGLDFERKISKLQKFVMSVNYFPDLSDFKNSRVDTKLSYELIIDAENNLSLKLGALDRYDSTPGDALHNDLDYSAVLLWSF